MEKGRKVVAKDSDDNVKGLLRLGKKGTKREWR